MKQPIAKISFKNYLFFILNFFLNYQTCRPKKNIILFLNIGRHLCQFSINQLDIFLKYFSSEMRRFMRK